MPRLDVEHAVNIQSPTNNEVTITNPDIPGLELRLPANTVIRDLDDKNVTNITITPIPVDRPPFPLPSGINVPIFFTIQPGGAQVIPPRARVIYPNYTNEKPGTRIDFWNYDPTEKGWYIYGQGTVTPDGKQVIPDPGVAIYEFSGVMINTTTFETPPADAPVPCNPCEIADPVDVSTGLFTYRTLALVHLALARLTRTTCSYGLRASIERQTLSCLMAAVCILKGRLPENTSPMGCSQPRALLVRSTRPNCSGSETV